MSDEETRINGNTLIEVVRYYLAELDNPAPDFTMRRVYREWMAAFVEAEKK